MSWFVHERLMHEACEMYDGQLQQSGRILAGIVRSGAGKIDPRELQTAVPEARFDHIPQRHWLVDEHIDRPGSYERVMGFQLVDDAGTLLFRSPGAPDAVLGAPQAARFNDIEIEGVRWRVLSFRDETSGQAIHIGEHYAVRQEISKYLLRSMRLPVLVGVIVIGILIWLSLAWGLKPLSKLAGEVRERDPEDLDAVDPGSTAAEIRPIVEALNGLLARVRKAFDAERRFTGDAAHELRTPLAALRVQSQVAQSALDDGERTKALSGVIAGVDRASRLVNQLLDLARVDWQRGPEPGGTVDLTQIVETVACELTEYARSRAISVVGRGATDASIRANAELVATLVRNLLDNAIRYSDMGGQVSWTVTRRARLVRLEISDTGPGIQPHERQPVFERFRRLPFSRESGAGLGLSIVRRIADIYSAEICLEAPATGHGLHVLVKFSAPGMDD